MALEEPQEGDVVLERSGVRIAVAGSFRIYFDNTVIDYEDSAFSRGFVLKPGSGPSGDTGDGEGEREPGPRVDEEGCDEPAPPASHGEPRAAGEPLSADRLIRDGRAATQATLGGTVPRRT